MNKIIKRRKNSLNKIKNISKQNKPRFLIISNFKIGSKL